MLGVRPHMRRCGADGIVLGRRWEIGMLGDANVVTDVRRWMEKTKTRIKKEGVKMGVVRAETASSSGQGGRARVVGSGSGARERRLHRVAEEKRRRRDEEDGKYPEWAT